VTDEFVVTVNPVDDPPTISVVEDQTTDRNDTAGPVRFTISDPDGDELTVSADSSDTGLVPDENIILAGAGENSTVTVTPGPDANGEAVETCSQGGCNFQHATPISHTEAQRPQRKNTDYNGFREP